MLLLLLLGGKCRPCAVCGPGFQPQPLTPSAELSVTLSRLLHTPPPQPQSQSRPHMWTRIPPQSQSQFRPPATTAARLMKAGALHCTATQVIALSKSLSLCLSLCVCVCVCLSLSPCLCLCSSTHSLHSLTLHGQDTRCVACPAGRFRPLPPLPTNR